MWCALNIPKIDQKMTERLTAVGATLQLLIGQTGDRLRWTNKHDKHEKVNDDDFANMSGCPLFQIFQKES